MEHSSVIALAKRAGIWCPARSLLSVAMTKTPNAPGTRKVRRATLGSKRAPGWEWQDAGRRARRADVRELKRGPDDPALSGVGGLVDFNALRAARAAGSPSFARLRISQIRQTKIGPRVATA